MPEARAFVFTCNGHQFGPRARTLKEFVTMQVRLPAAALEGHAQRGDFSRWIRNVFGDEPLAVEIKQVETDFRKGRLAKLSESLAAPIHQRYELGRESLESFRSNVRFSGRHESRTGAEMNTNEE